MSRACNVHLGRERPLIEKTHAQEIVPIRRNSCSALMPPNGARPWARFSSYVLGA